MAVDYTFTAPIRWGETYNLPLTGGHFFGVFCPNNSDHTKDQFAIADRNSEVARLAQRAADGEWGGANIEVITPSLGSRIVEAVEFSRGASTINDQLILIDGSSDRLFFYSRDTNGIFSSSSAESILALSINAFSTVQAAYLNGDPTKDQLIVGGAGLNIEIVDRNLSTGLFDSGSPLTALSPAGAVGNYSRVVFAPNSEDHTKDQVIGVGNDWSTIQRNSTTEKFDSGSALDSLSQSSLTGTRQTIFCPNSEDHTKDQLIGVTDGTDTLIAVQRDSTTGLFNSSSTVYTRTVNDRPFSLAFVPSRVNATNDFIVVGALNSADYFVIYRSKTSGLFDGTSVTETINTPAISRGSGGDYVPYDDDPRLDAVIFGTLDAQLIITKTGTREIIASPISTLLIPDSPNFTGSEALQYNASGRIILTASQTFYIFDAFISAVADLNLINITRNGNTNLVINSGELTINATGEIIGDFLITMGPGTTLDLSSATLATRSENITLDATSTVILNGDTLAAINLESFTFAAGTTIDNAGAADVSVTVGSDPGIVTTSSGGGVVNVLAPQPTLTIQGIPSGGILTIWDDEDADPQDLGTLLQTTSPTDGNGIDYIGTPGNDVVIQFVPNTGDSALYKEFHRTFTIPAQSQNLDLLQDLELEDNL